MNFKKDNVMDTAYKDYVFSEKEEIDNIKIYRFEDKTGYGEMQSYNLLKGIQLSYNNLNMESVYQDIEPKNGILKIDHCLDGCYEVKLKNSEYVFFGKGDLSIIDLGSAQFENSRVPMKTYKGLSIFIDVNLAQKTIERYFPFLSMDIEKIRERFCGKRAFSIINSKHEINKIVNELYKTDERIQVPYLIIKIVELFLFLEIVETKDIDKVTSFSKPVYEATKECYTDLLNNPFERYSIAELAKKYAVSESSLKRCFGHITGNSIGDFKRTLILKESSKLLTQRLDMSIRDISDVAGYVNQSKFSAAFKSYYGVTPSKYRNKYTHDNISKVDMI